MQLVSKGGARRRRIPKGLEKKGKGGGRPVLSRSGREKRFFQLLVIERLGGGENLGDSGNRRETGSGNSLNLSVVGREVLGI